MNRDDIQYDISKGENSSAPLLDAKCGGHNEIEGNGERSVPLQCRVFTRLAGGIKNARRR